MTKTQSMAVEITTFSHRFKDILSLMPTDLDDSDEGLLVALLLLYGGLLLAAVIHQPLLDLVKPDQ